MRIIASNNSLRLDPIWIREEMEEVGRVVVLQDPPKYPDIRILITHRAIRKNAFVLFFVWLVYGSDHLLSISSIIDIIRKKFKSLFGMQLGSERF